MRNYEVGLVRNTNGNIFKASATSCCYLCKTKCPRGRMVWSAAGPVIVCSDKCATEVTEGKEVRDALFAAERDRP